MDPTLKKMWTKALRSGAYEQGTGTLRKYGAFCCLGVLCEVAEVPNYVDICDSAEDYQERFGMKYGLSVLKIQDLIDKNDNGEPFENIAAYIEENL